MESKDYERHSETIAIPPAHVALIAYPFGSSRGLRTCIQSCKQERDALPTDDKRKPANQDQSPV
jgi:hypothetical protein